MAKEKPLTYKQKMAAKLFAETGDARYALDKAGYAPSMMPGPVLGNPGVMAEVVNHRLDAIRRMDAEALPRTVDKIITILDDPETPLKAQIDVMKMVLVHTVGRRQDTQDNKDAVDMTPAEVNARIAELRAAQTMRAIADATIEGEARPVEGDSIFD